MFFGIKSEKELEAELLKKNESTIKEIEEFFGNSVVGIKALTDRDEVYAFFKEDSDVAKFCWDTWGSQLNDSNGTVGFPIGRVSLFASLSYQSEHYSKEMSKKFPNMKFVRFYLNDDFEAKIVFVNGNDGTRHEYFMSEMESIV